MVSKRNRYRALTLSGCLALLVAFGSPGLTAAQDLQRGEELYGLCSQCHGPEGAGSRLALAPAIAGLGGWYVTRQLQKFQAGIRGLHPNDVGGLRMYPMSLSLKDESDVDSVSAYVASLPPVRPAPELTGGDPARGKILWAPCVACHGADAQGNEQLGGPRLHGSDWYLLTQLEHFKSGIRGSNPQDVQGALMRAMSNTLVDEQAMKDVLAYIQTLPGK